MRAFSLVVAADARRGIGKNNDLPWPTLPQDVAHFARVTTETHVVGARNAVVMGRLTWESLPTTYQPLPRRLNVVVTRNREYHAPADVVVAHDVREGIERVEGDVERVFVVGGEKIYRRALLLPACEEIYYTRINTKTDAETWFPAFEDAFTLCSVLTTAANEALPYQIERWRRVGAV